MRRRALSLGRAAGLVPAAGRGLELKQCDGDVSGYPDGRRTYQRWGTGQTRTTASSTVIALTPLQHQTAEGVSRSTCQTRWAMTPARLAHHILARHAAGSAT